MKTAIPNRKFIPFQIVLIITSGLLVYANALYGKFLWDDYGLVRDNNYIKSFFHIGKIFITNIGAGRDVVSDFYRPMQIFTYALDYSLWGLNTIGYHLTSVLFHIAVALLLYWLVNIIFKNYWLSFLSALLFVVHPVHTETVAYVAGRADILAAFFILLTLIFYVRYIESNRNKLFVFVLLFYPAALLSKECSLILPLLIAFYHYVFKIKIKIKVLLFLFIEIAAYAFLRFLALKSQPDVLISTPSLYARLPGSFLAISEYIKLTLLPFNLHMEYGLKLFKFSEPGVIAGMCIVLTGLLCLVKRWGQPIWVFAIGWFFITLFPALNIYPVNAYMAEHWLYLPSLGIFIVISFGIINLYKLRLFRLCSIILTILLVYFYAFLTMQQNNYWQTPFIFLERTLQYAPHSPRINSELGDEYAALRNDAKALEFYEKAMRIDPRYQSAYIGLGNLYYVSGKAMEALGIYQKAIDINPNFSEPYIGLGNTLFALNRKAEAIKSYEKAILLRPDLAYAYYNITVAYLSLKEYKMAIKYWDIAMRLGYKANPALEKILKPYR